MNCEQLCTKLVIELTLLFMAIIGKTVQYTMVISPFYPESVYFPHSARMRSSISFHSLCCWFQYL